MQGPMEDLGLTAYEARALAHLLRHGERTGPELSREADLPFGRVYDTLNALADRGLVRITTGRPKRYAAVPADTVPRLLLAAERRRIQEQERQAAEKAHALEESLRGVGPGVEPTRNSYGITLGEDSARRFLVEATHSTRDEVVAFLVFEELHDEDLDLFEAFRAAVRRGLRTRILLRSKDIDYLMQTPYVDDVLDALLPHMGDTLQVRLCDDDGIPFAALDGERAMLGIKNPLDPAAYFAVVHVEDAAFALGLQAKFDAMWQDAEEPRDLIQWALGKRGGRALAKLGARIRSGKP